MEAEQLDTILGLQLSVAWAGEKADNPTRLGWWYTDLTDKEAGGDLFKRLLPRTAAWTGLEMAREAAIRADRAARASLPQPDRTWTLFHFGFDVDEALHDRLEQHKRRGTSPKEALSAAWGIAAAWSREGFETFLEGLGTVKSKQSPAGRHLSKLPSDITDVARAFAASLLPLSEAYPLPHADMPEPTPS